MKRMKWLFAVFVLGAMLCLRLIYTPANGSEKLPETSLRTNISSQELSNRIATAYNKINNLSANVSIHFKLINAGIGFDSTGAFYYKEPDKTSLQLNGIPKFLLDQENAGVLRSVDILAGLRREITLEYDAGVVDQIKLDGKLCYTVKLIPKTKEDVARILVWVDAEQYTMPLAILIYNDGSTLTQKKRYLPCGGVYVAKEIRTFYDSPKTQAEIDASIQNCEVNKPIPDSFFKNRKASNLVSPF